MVIKSDYFSPSAPYYFFANTPFNQVLFEMFLHCRKVNKRSVFLWKCFFAVYGSMKLVFILVTWEYLNMLNLIQIFVWPTIIFIFFQIFLDFEFASFLTLRLCNFSPFLGRVKNESGGGRRVLAHSGGGDRSVHWSSFN